MSDLTHSLSTKLALAFLVSALVPAGAGLFVFEQRTQLATLQRLEAHQRDLALDREHLLTQHIVSIQRDVGMLAESELVRNFLRGLPEASHDDEIGALAEDLVHRAQTHLWGATHHVFVTDVEGTVVLSPPHGEYAVPCRAPFSSDPKTRPALDVHLGDSLAGYDFLEPALRDAHVTSFFAFEERDHYHQLVTHPVRDRNGATIGVVVAEVAIDAVERLLARDIELGASGQVALTTNDGRRVVHDKGVEPVPLQASGLESAIRTGALAFATEDSATGRSIAGTYLPSATFPWVVCIEADQDEALQSMIATRSLMVRVFLALALALGLVGVFLGLWFGVPLRRCARAAKRVGLGELEEPIPITRGRDEVGILERATERMRQRLLEQIHQLDDQVTVRTAALQGALARVRRSEQRLAHAVRGSMDGLWDWNLETDEVYYAPRWKELLGASEEEIGDSPDEWYRRIPSAKLAEFKRRLEEHIAGETDRLDFELQMVHADGGLRWMLCRAAAIRDAAGQALRLSGSLADITALKQAQEKVQRLALHDQLTGLANRELLSERLKHAIARLRRDPESEKTYAVMFFDFDRFKVINDSLGHNIGDALLANIATRLRAHIREVDTAARFGGDEFVVLLDGVDGFEGAAASCQRLLEVFEEPHYLQGHEVVSTASIGLVVGHPGYATAEEVLRDADAAMYQAKAAGKAQYRAFDDAMFDAARRRLLLERDLRNADMEQEFLLHYQPIVALQTCEISGFEALVRWEHPRLGLVPPDEFISIAEETGLIVQLGDWVLRTACRQLVEWREAFPDREFFVNVNVSRRQLTQPDLLDNLRAVVDEFRIVPGELKLEITETTVMDARYDSGPVMEGIRDLGILLAMDDFGTGQSSLSCLHQFPIDVLKIDRSFIVNIEERPQFTAVMQAIITLAHHLDLDVVAEGIETPAQLAQLQVMDCEFAQGYLFSRPVPADQATVLLRDGFQQRLSA